MSIYSAYVAYPWSPPEGTHLQMSSQENFMAAFCGSFPIAERIGPRMDMEGAMYWFSLGDRSGIVYW